MHIFYVSAYTCTCTVFGMDNLNGASSVRGYLLHSGRVLTRSTIEGGRGCNKFVPALGGDGTKRSSTGDIFDQPPGEMS